tara:strand:- start:439 stop:1098 length:660 start_codon:yes stop_codon:yes gene_type:complete
VSRSPIGESEFRFAPLLRWLGLTLIVVLLLQMAAVVVAIDWADTSRPPQLTGPLVALAPLGFLGLLVTLIASRLDHPQQRHTPLRWVVFGCSALLAAGMIAAIPISLSSGAGDASQLQNLEQGRQALKEARQFRDDEQQVAALGEQLAQAGQLAADATEDDKRLAAEVMVDEQIDQMEAQLQRFEVQRTRESRQRLIGGTASAVALAVAFALLALTAVL